MKNLLNLTKDYVSGFAEGFEEFSLKIPYFYCSSQNEDLQKYSKFMAKGVKHGSELGIISALIQAFVCINIAKTNPEIFLIPTGTNLLSILYENYKFLWKN